ncbi:MAG: hypothetical protein SOZ80_02120 [Prevotella sp.]|uniref:hypothetical protein n=1 Tax=Prevotella sp. TaxID=59823 RepID=UPI002A28672B|nr:hypothetical protein [Prevotella sp.]MDD7318788.1 hypothetical protein [Prevotellaceae bacterium]MDY4019564.1 hypothetical protein [Prevotella sp.]
MKKLIVICFLWFSVATLSFAQVPRVLEKGTNSIDSVMTVLQMRFDPYHLYVPKTGDGTQRSIMFAGKRMQPKLDTRQFIAGPFRIPDPPSLFEEEDNYYRRSRNQPLGECIVETLINMLLCL